VCDEHAGPAEVLAGVPRPAEGTAVDPIALEPVDEVRITTLIDNVFDALLTGDDRVTRVNPGQAWETAAQFEGGRTDPGLRAEHGFAALVTVRRGASTTTLLFDTGLSPDGMVTNASRMGIDLSDIHGVVLSHGHYDHAGGLAGLAGRRGSRALPMVVHPGAWTRRRLAVGGREIHELPTLSRRALAGEGFEVVERREPSVLVDGSVLITGEVDRTTEFEHGMPPAHQAWTGSGWEHDARVQDDQALVVNVRDRGLVVLTGCGHAGAVNIVRHAQRLTGVDRLHALLGGLHLGGPFFEPVIPPTVAAFIDMGPAMVVPGHCTGWRAQHALAAALPDAWLPNSSGSTYLIAA
jgi:7,8-dihydropterin-6-yl-methyl-4-(beta-D-ribofuranosyl)aminobenzene 5'-phosphate synthase